MSSPPEDAGAPPRSDREPTSTLSQLDPSTKDYAYYALSDERGTLAEVIVAATPNGDFAAAREYWKVHRDFDTSAMSKVDLSKTAGDWPAPPFPASDASFVLPMGTRWQPLPVAPDLSSSASFGIKARVSLVGGVYTYSIAWYNQTGESMFKDVELPFRITLMTQGMDTFEWYYAENKNPG